MVIVGSSVGTIYAYDAQTGASLGSAYTGATINYLDEINLSAPAVAMGAGEGYLVVPAGSTLTGWRLSP